MSFGAVGILGDVNLLGDTESPLGSPLENSLENILEKALEDPSLLHEPARARAMASQAPRSECSGYGWGIVEETEQDPKPKSNSKAGYSGA